MDEMSEYIKQLEVGGYIDKKGYPLKCMNCEGTEFTMVDDHYCNMGLEEYSLKCDNCGVIVGHWAYGNWQINVTKQN